LPIDDRAISQSEHSGLFYKSAGSMAFIGRGTTGANGDVTFFTAPGGIRIDFSGHDVRWPHSKPLQRAGLIPDIEAHPTIAGIRAGKDKILDRAITCIEKAKQQILRRIHMGTTRGFRVTSHNRTATAIAPRKSAGAVRKKGLEIRQPRCIIPHKRS
jgi:C-terminal processing protease CtpA/Prc